MPSSNIYLGSNQILEAQGSRRIYLGTQLICKAYLGSNLVFDNCGYIPYTTTMLYSGGVSGDAIGYSISGNTSGSTVSGQGGVDTYSFTTSVSTASGYSGNPTVNGSASSTLSGTIPVGGSTVYMNFAGSVTPPAPPTFTDTYVASTSSGLSSGNTSVSPTSVTGVQNSTSEATWTFTGSSSYTYTSMQIDIGGSVYAMSGGPTTYTYTNTGNTISSSNRTITGTVGGTQTLITSNHTINLSQVIGGLGASYTNTTYTIFGNNITVTATGGSLTGNLNSGDVDVEINGTGTATASISSSSYGGYSLTANNNTSTSFTVGTGSPTTLTFNNNTIETAHTSYGTGPYLSLSAANSGGGSSITFEYTGGSEGVMPSYGSRIYTSWIPANYPSQFSGELTNYRWYVDEEYNVFAYYNGTTSP